MLRRPVLSSARPRRLSARTLAVGGALVALGGLVGPPVASAAQNVFIDNTTANPVPTRAVGTTPVSGTVGIASGTKVALADGTTVALEDGAVVRLADNTVRLADGSAVTLADGSAVVLKPGSVVALADGSSVRLSEPVRLADGTTVGLADGSSVAVANTNANPVPVEVVGGATGGSGAPEPFQVAGSRNGAGCTDDLLADVPAGRRVVITNVQADSSGTAAPVVELWATQRTAGGGFFTHFVKVPMTPGAGQARSGGAEEVLLHFAPGSTEPGDLFVARLCLEEGASGAAASARYIISGRLE